MKNVDEKGNQILYDVREDEEQISKMNEICELFVAAGYFRARIKGLPNFDKVRMRRSFFPPNTHFVLDNRRHVLGNTDVQHRS